MMIVSPPVTLLLLPLRRPDGGMETPVFGPGVTSGEAVGGGRGFGEETETGMFAFVTPTLKGL